MRALVQRVRWASVSVQGERISSIGPGLVIFLAIAQDDSEEDIRYLVDKIVHQRIFPDAQDRFHLSALGVGAELLLISQFTLYGETRKGRRPSFTRAAPPALAQELFQRAVEALRSTGLNVATGRFQEHMLVELCNDGPVTLWLDSADRLRPRG